MMRKWGNTSWHTLPRNDDNREALELHTVSVALSDTSTRSFHFAAENDVTITAITVDGRKWQAPKRIDWEDKCEID